MFKNRSCVRLAGGVGALLVTACTCHASILYVKAGLATGANNGSSWADAFRGREGLQGALAAATAGDEIWVAAGEYAPAAAGGSRMTSFVLKNGVSVLGGFGGGETSSGQRNPALHACTLTGDLSNNDLANLANRCDNSAHVIRSTGNDATAVIDGFVVRGGSAVTCGSMNVVDVEDGGGALIEGGAPSIRSCTFTDNMAGGSGGGMCVYAGSPTVRSCVFEANTSFDNGAGAATIKGSGAAFEGCSFRLNSGSRGVGLFAGARFGDAASLGGTLLVHDCLFTDNTGTIGATSGGAILSSMCASRIEDTSMAGNVANGGGAVFVDGGVVDLRRCGIAGNLANGDLGDVLYIETGGAASLSNCSITGHVRKGIAGDASAFVVRGPLIVESCTIARNGGTAGGANWGAGVFVLQGGSVIARNSVVWGNLSFGGGGQQAVVFNGGGTARFDRCCVEGWNGTLAGNASFGTDPLLMDVDGLDNILGTLDDNVRLGGGSPCIDRGDNGLGAVLSARDLSGGDRYVNDPSIVDGGIGGAMGGCAIIDVGCFEHLAFEACRADVDCSGFVDTDDFDAFVMSFENGDGSADFDLSGFVDTDDFDAFVNAFEAGC